MASPKKYMVIACEVLFREICLCAAQCGNIIDISFMEKGLHDIGEKRMYKALQQEIDKVETEKYDAILLCYGLCNNGIRNIHARLPVVVPRAHDCISLLLGSKEKYADYFFKNPGTFFLSSGWIERNTQPDKAEDSVPGQLGMDKTYEEYAELYGEENAEYLMEFFGNWLVHYKKLAFINNQVGDTAYFREQAKGMAAAQQWEFEEIGGDTNLIFRLLNGDWDPGAFLVLSPGSKIIPANNENIITCAAMEDGL
ncbi:MAG: DUF1638 domain-containing protein [Clostridiales bacterium]|nr:DUF1638 domain-containing protein [Clostridiales bacterium]